MLPENVLSSKAIVQAYPDPVKQPGDFLVDWERAGIGLRDTSQGLLVQVWKLEVEEDKDLPGKFHFNLSAPQVEKFTFFSYDDVSHASLCFDQNMNPFIAFVSANRAYINWYDPTIPGQTITALPADYITPHCTTDDKRPQNLANSDIVLAYVRAGNLCVVYQRDRYQVEHVLCPVGNGAELVSFAMTSGSRLQFRVRKVTAATGSETYRVVADPFLADVVQGLCLRAGILPESINVSELYDQNVIGFKVNTKDGVNARIDALRKIFFFDKSERARALFFPRRGRQVTARIPYVDLVADDPSALSVTLIQEKELPAEVNVTHLDPAGGFANNKQTVRRKSNLVSTTAKRDIESEVVLTADQAATTALVSSVTAWAEPQKYKFKTTIKYAAVVATDTVEVEDKTGRWHIVRITERNEDGSVLSFEGNADAQELYASLGVGKPLPPPVSTTPGLIGPTRLEILNIPCLRDQDDELGVYLAVCGESSGWFGSSILVATDGINFAEAMTIETPATIGDLQTDLKAEVSAEYPSNQSFEVLTNYALESVSTTSLLNNINRCVVGDEVLQFKTALFLGMVDGKYRYRCSGLIRGRYATEVEAWPVNTRFVLLDTSIAFLQAQQWMLGREISIKPVSSGQTEDETAQTDYDFDVGMSQLEFPVSDVRAVRSGGNVTTTFIGRGRLGVGSAPRNGKYFIGYRVKYSNGQSFDVQTESHTYNSAPSGITVQVCALNSVTGEGPYSSPIPT